MYIPLLKEIDNSKRVSKKRLIQFQNFFPRLIWQAFGTYILILLAGIIIVKIAFKVSKIKHSKTLIP